MLIEGKKNSLMTTGTIWKRLLFFSLPLLLGNVFQLLYTTADSIFMGQFVGVDALAAVGASSPLINLLISFFMGLSTGAGIIIARFRGENKMAELEDAVHTMIAFTIIIGLVLMVVGILLSPVLLLMLNTPLNIMGDAVLFLRVYFMGIMGLVLYNAGAGILQAMGDSRTSLYILIISFVVNVLLDFWFVVGLQWGIGGIAGATFVAQMISCGLTLWKLKLGHDGMSLKFKKIRLHREMLARIVVVGVPTGIQQMIISLSNVLVQSYVNVFGEAAIAGFNAASTLNNFLGLPATSFGLAITTFTSQNIGAKQMDRVRQGVKTCCFMGLVTMILIGIPAFVFAPESVRIFTSDASVIDYGVQMIRVLTPFYTALCLSNVLTGYIRGAGNTRAPMFIFIFSYTVVRQILLFIAMPLFKSIDVVFWSYSITWVIAMLLSFYYYRNAQWLKELNAAPVQYSKEAS